MRHSKEEIEKVVEEYKAGASIVELCNKYNLAFGTVQNWMIKNNCIRNYKPYHFKNSKRCMQNYIIHDDYAEIELRSRDGTSYVKIDVEDVERCKALGIWSAGGNGYILAKIKDTGENVYLHRFIMNATDNSITIDHINHDLLDCRKQNLRFATMSQNMMNQHIRKDNSSGVRGVDFDKSRGKWCARMSANKKRFHKRFDTFEEAVAYRKMLEDKYFGEFKFNESA